MKKHIFHTIGCLTLLFLVSCAANIPLTHYYTFQPLFNKSTEAKSPKYPYILGIDAFEADTPYQQERIVYRTSPYEINFYEYRRWLRPPTELVMQQVRKHIKMAALCTRVHTFSFESYADYIIQGEITMFDQWYQDKNTSLIQVGIQYQLLDSETEQILWIDNIETTATVPSLAISIEIVKGFESALQRNIQQMLIAIENVFAQRQ